MARYSVRYKCHTCLPLQLLGTTNRWAWHGNTSHWRQWRLFASYQSKIGLDATLFKTTSINRHLLNDVRIVQAGNAKMLFVNLGPVVKMSFNENDNFSTNQNTTVRMTMKFNIVFLDCLELFHWNIIRSCGRDVWRTKCKLVWVGNGPTITNADN